ncbi:transcriptional repressor p66-beta [Halyomorpha halys]|uniref:transcriptional repressor p66-beta n=1 Tax=Halyomorpha halys TaxID=286706 RepID=UPI0006D4F72E|nr:transcriptional repressor p66-beta [Halyomorpha halys]
MEGMEVDEGVVDLSVSSRRVSEMMPPNSFPVRSGIVWNHRRSLRPRTDPRSYVDSHDIVIVTDDEPKANGLTNGAYESEEEDHNEAPIIVTPIKEMSEQQLLEREKIVRKLRDELRNEEMTLVLLKKLRQSHQMKENIAVVAPCNNNQTPVQGPVHATKPTPPRSSSKPISQPALHLLNRQPGINTRSVPGVFAPPPVIGNRNIAPGLPVTLQPTNSSISRSNNNVSVRNMGITFPPERKDSRNSPVPVVPAQDRVRLDESQTPAQRQAAAKLALRKQLEKTLLQIPPPKPPPPEMHFIPNPSNTEFIYLVGLEHVVDFITKDSRSPPPPEPFRCSQCLTNFTPVWKWEKGTSKGKEPKVICEQCVTTNVKKALKAEHTNRLKTAFVKALQQEQEIEQRLAQGSPQPEPPPTPQPVVKPSTPKPTPPIPSPNRDHLAKLADSAKFNHHAAAALHQQLLRGLPQHQPLPAHMIPFSPLLYQYQFAMAQAAGGKVPVAAAAANIVELQRQAADIQRQYLLDMIPSPNTRHTMNNWKT